MPLQPPPVQWGDDEHDRAYRELMALRGKAFILLVQSIRDKKTLPDDLMRQIKYDISQTYFRREYDKLHEQVIELGALIDELLKPKPEAVPASDAG
jgi:hypothetical protein